MASDEDAMFTYKEFHRQVYVQEIAVRPYGLLQWKGTDACIDLHCTCGHAGHYDGDFLYYYRCSACGAKYALGSAVKLIQLTPEQASYVERERGGFKTEQ